VLRKYGIPHQKNNGRNRNPTPIGFPMPSQSRFWVKAGNKREKYTPYIEQ